MSARSFQRDAMSTRPVTIERDYLKNVPGSCLVSFGDTKVLCAATIEDGVAGWLRGTGRGWVTAEYSMLPASTGRRSRREVRGQSGRTHEIQRLIGRSLRTVVDLSGLGGEVTVTVDCDVIQADGGTRTAAITGAWVALYDALDTWRTAGRIPENPVFDQVAGVSVGIVDGELRVDLDYAEDSVAEVDMNVVMDGAGRFIEVQGTGESTPFSRETLDEMLDAAAAAIGDLLVIQREVLEGERR